MWFDTWQWILANPDRYVMAGMGIAAVVIIGVLVVGGNPGVLFVGPAHWVVTAWVAYLFLWPIVIAACLLLMFIAAGMEDT